MLPMLLLLLPVLLLLLSELFLVFRLLVPLVFPKYLR